MYLSSSTGLSLRVLLLRLKHTTVNTATITSTMRTIDIGSTVVNTVGTGLEAGPGQEKDNYLDVLNK